MKEQLLYIFRVYLIEEDFTIYRDIAILPTQSLFLLIEAIHKAFNYNQSESAFFFELDGEGYKEKEFERKDWKQLKMYVLITDPHQAFYYVFDPNKLFEFRLELISLKEINEDKENTDKATIKSMDNQYPKCIKKVGSAPEQYNPEELPEKLLQKSDLGNVTNLMKDVQDVAIRIKSSVRHFK